MQREPLQIGILLPTRGVLFQEGGQVDAEPVLTMAEAAEALGCASVWVGDSLTSRPRLEPIVTLAAVAARTRRVRLGTAILLAALRHPVLLAHAVATLDVLSRGRTVLALGVGGAASESLQREWLTVGVLPQQRVRRLEEGVAVMRRLWAGSSASFQGRHFQLQEVTLEPRPWQRPGVPLWFACHLRSGSEAQYRRAGILGDGVMSIREGPEEYAQVLEKVRVYARGAGRDPAALETAFYLTVNLGLDEGKAREEALEFLRRYYGVGRPEPGMVFGRPEAVVSLIQRYAQAGARHVIVRFASFEGMKQLETFGREVLPALAR
ncbi:MAG: LLM class flavin-dependent oxidoreductase [Chloroflexi bacterium]|nr:LLM class flavin-dependent oxidoreductase [Chloroflexota bacterium]